MFPSQDEVFGVVEILQICTTVLLTSLHPIQGSELQRKLARI